MTTTAYSLWLDGRSVAGERTARIDRRSPAHDTLVSTYVAGTANDVDAAVAAAKRALAAPAWSGLTGADRAGILTRTATLIRRDARALAEIETLESGKPIAQARDEMGWAAGIWDYAAALARQLHGESYNTLGSAHLGLTLREPIGVVGLITPWNFPLLIISQKLPFALAAGCTCVVKPSEFTSGTTLRLAALLKEAGLPDGVCNVITGYGDPVGQRIAEHPDIAMVSFTGSTAVGRKVVSASAATLKKVALELGGKNPQIIFPDADLDAAVDAVVFGVFFNMGECCNSGSRILVHASIADDFVTRVVAAAKNVRVGDPLDESTKVGAIINRTQFDKICGFLADGTAAGAAVRLGGGPLAAQPGLYIQPTLLDHVKPDMRVAREEIFGPVLSVLRFESEDEAVRIANDVAYGLSASVWTRDLDRALGLSRRIEAGTVWVNCFMDGFSELPFGGYKQSGLGRELGQHAVEEYTETKTLLIHQGPRTGWWAR
jgi:betaine-aldehyde dehydrogenase